MRDARDAVREAKRLRDAATAPTTTEVSAQLAAGLDALADGLDALLDALEHARALEGR